jgi:hypothetical protein
MSELEVGQRWRHLKRGDIYEIIAIGCRAQASFLGEDGLVSAQLMIEEGDWVAYRPETGTTLYFRHEQEFLDGRFELVAP